MCIYTCSCDSCKDQLVIVWILCVYALALYIEPYKDYAIQFIGLGNKCADGQMLVSRLVDCVSIYKEATCITQYVQLYTCTWLALATCISQQ